MSALGEAVDEYLALRRSLGYKLEAHGRLLPQFAEFCEQRQATVITTAMALEWATQPAERSVVWWHQRLAIAAGFARYLKASDPRHEVPPGRPAASEVPPRDPLSVFREARSRR